MTTIIGSPPLFFGTSPILINGISGAPFSGGPLTWSLDPAFLPASFGPQTANTIFAGPTSGIAATPTFRSLNSADLGGILTSTSTIAFTHNDPSNMITADIVAASISNSLLRTSGALSVIGRSANSTGAPADIVASNDGDILRRLGTTLGFGSALPASISLSTNNLLLGRYTASAGGAQEVTIGSNLALSGAGVLSATGGGTVTLVSGTTNRIVITGTPTIGPIVDIDAAYVGQASITTLGTLVNGIWNAGNLTANSTTSSDAVITSFYNSSLGTGKARFVADSASFSGLSDAYYEAKNSTAGVGFVWGLKISNSTWRLSNGAALGTNDLISITTGGAASLLSGNLDITRSASGATVSATVANTNNANGTSNAIVIASCGGASGGDPSWQTTISGVTTVSGGLDNSDSDSYKEQFSSTIGSSPFRVVTSSGITTSPLQSAFEAYLGSADNNVTGDNTTYKLGTNVAWTKVSDRAGDFNTNGTFIARATGFHVFSLSAQIGGLAATNTIIVGALVTTSGTYEFGDETGIVRDSNNNTIISAAKVVFMTAGDSAIFNVTVFGVSKVVDINSFQRDTHFSGYLLG